MVEEILWNDGKNSSFESSLQMTSLPVIRIRRHPNIPTSAVCAAADDIDTVPHLLNWQYVSNFPSFVWNSEITCFDIHLVSFLQVDYDRTVIVVTSGLMLQGGHVERRERAGVRRPEAAIAPVLPVHFSVMLRHNCIKMR